MDQIQTVQQFFCASLGRSLCRGNKHRGIDPSILSSGHHESWLFHKGCFSLNCCQTAILPHLGTLNSAYWALSTFQSSFIWAMSFDLWHYEVSTKACLSKPAKITFGESKHVNSWIKFGLYNSASPGRSFCHGNGHRGIDPSIFSSGPSWLFHKGCLSLNCCQTAILPHLGTLNSAYWALSTFQSSFIWAISFGCSMTLWSVHKGVPKQTCKNYLRRKQACKLMDQIWTVQQFCASPGRSFCHGNEHRGIDPSIFSSGPSWLFHKGCLSIPVEITQEDLCHQFVVTTGVLTTCALTERPAPPPQSLTQRYHRSRVSIKKGLLQKGHDHMLWSKITTHYLQSCTVWVDLAIAFCRHNCLNKS